MVTIDGEQGYLITCCRQQERRQQSHKYLPEDIWREILSRLPIKSLFITGCVCKSWRNIFFDVGNKIDTDDPMYIPVCGLFLIRLGLDMKESFSYICLRTKTCVSTHFATPENNKLYYSSGFESGLLTDLSFDFSIISNFTSRARDERFAAFIVSRGLIVVVLDVASWEVHNPATKQIYVVPSSPITAKYGFKCHKPAEKPGHIIKLPSRLTEQRPGFIFVLFSTQLRIIEVYYSITRTWRKYDITLAEIMTAGSYCYAYLDVVCNESGVLWLYMLTNRGVVVAVKFEGSMNSELNQYCFPLPEIVAGGILCNQNIWGCENSLYLSYFNDTGLWVWKAGCTQIDAWAWVPMIEINPARQWCKPVVREHLSKVVLDATARVMVLSWHPDVAVMYLLVKTSIFAYNFNTDTLDMICRVEDGADEHTYYHYTTIPFKPFLNFFECSKSVCQSKSRVLQKLQMEEPLVD